MRSKPSYLPMLVSVGFLLSGVVSVGTVAWCDFFGSCKFGKYQAKLTLLDANTRKPMASRTLSPMVSSGTPSIANNTEEGGIVITDSEGKAEIEFNRVFHSRLSIEVLSESPESRALFGFNVKDIKEYTTLTQMDSENFAGEIEGKAKMKLILEVGNWSLGSVQQDGMEE
jgi:hypothetical protein